MASAPRDGTEILVLDSYGCIHHVAWNGPHNNAWKTVTYIHFIDNPVKWRPVSDLLDSEDYAKRLDSHQMRDKGESDDESRRSYYGKEEDELTVDDRLQRLEDYVFLGEEVFFKGEKAEY